MTTPGLIAAPDWHDLGAQWPEAYEWFYFDIADERTGVQLSIEFLAPNPFDLTPFANGPQGPRCAACTPVPRTARHVGVVVDVTLPPQSPGDSPRWLPTQQFLHDEPATAVQFRPAPWELRIAGSTLRRDDAAARLPVYELALDVAGMGGMHFAGALTFRATHPAWMVPDALLFEQQSDPTHWHRWAVHAPLATVHGEYRLDTPAGPLTGKLEGADGYHDHNWGTRRPCRAFQRWMWARGSAGDEAVVAAALVPNAQAAPVDLRVASLLAVSTPAGLASNTLFAFNPGVPPAGTTGQPYPQTIDVGSPEAAGTAYHAVFTHKYVAFEFYEPQVASFYQRRLATVTLRAAGRPDPASGLAVAETMIPPTLP